MPPEHTHAHTHERSTDKVTVSFGSDFVKKVLPWLLGAGIIGGGGTGIFGVVGKVDALQKAISTIEAKQGKQDEKMDGMKEDLKDIKRYLYQRRDR